MSARLTAVDTELTAAAIALGAIGLPVFPCGASKKPCISKREGGRGFHDASTDPDEIRRLFSHRGARLIGVPTGEASGWDILDFDYRNGAKAFEDANAHRLPETRIHQTQSGGRHIIFRHAPGVRNSESSIAPGVDVRGTGGYAVLPPSPGYSIVSDADPCPWPEWLLAMVLPKPKPAAPVAPSTPRQPVSSKRLDRIVEGALAKVRAAPDGQKHNILRDQALLLGGIQHLAGFSAGEAVRWLMDALPASAKDRNAAEETAIWGVENGRARPVEIEDRLRVVGGYEAHANAMPADFDDAGYFASLEADAGYAGDEPDPAIGEEASAERAAAAAGAAEADAAAKVVNAAELAERGAELRALLSVYSWSERDIPEPDRLLGDLITTTTRVFLVGRTGLGKTLLGIAIAAGVASGQGFLKWRSSRPARVLYIDGEMPAELIKLRARDALRRLEDTSIAPGNLLIFGRDIEAEARKVYPMLPEFAPLNTEGGRAFLLALIKVIGGIDLLVFDNVMSLISGDQKDEVPWSETLPLVSTLTDMRIGQLWLDHTGHNSDRQYGSSTKAWRFDAVGVMGPLKDGESDPRSTGFALSFDHPGKARRRTPDNWQDFEAQIIHLANDEWTAEPVERAQGGSKESGAYVPPAAVAQHNALLDALVTSRTLGQATRDAWYAECVRHGLAVELHPNDSRSVRERKQKTFRTYMSMLKVARWVGVNDDVVTNLRAGSRG
jgi:hypothetical protein